MAKAQAGRLARVLRGRPARAAAVLAACALLSSCTGSADGVPSAPPPSRTAGAQASPVSESPSTPTPSETPEPPPEADTCRQLTIPDLRSIVDDSGTVPCRGPHTVVTFHVGRLPAKVTADALAPNEERVQSTADRICTRAFRDYVGGTAAQRRLSMLTPTYFLPQTEQFTLGADWVRCDVYAYANPDELAELPRSLQNAMERQRTRDDLARCAPVSPSQPRFRHVICTEPHRWRAVDTESLGGPDERYPGRNTVQRRARAKCERPVRNYLDTDEGFSYGFEVPQRDAWATGDRVGLCWARTTE